MFKHLSLYLQDVMHTICSPHGEVLRIMVMRKQNVTALVEFDNSESAQKAKQALHGCDVYSGCCTLKIEFAGVRYYLVYFLRQLCHISPSVKSEVWNLIPQFTL